MSIKYVKGNLFECEEKYIGHGCNAQGVMGSGVAKIIKQKYPLAFKIYYEHHKQEGLYVGEVLSAACGDKTILNMITQDHFGSFEDVRYVSYDGVANCFKNINMRYQGISLAIPKIGAGLGNGNWKVIETIIKEYAPDIKVVVYEPN